MHTKTSLAKSRPLYFGLIELTTVESQQWRNYPVNLITEKCMSCCNCYVQMMLSDPTRGLLTSWQDRFVIVVKFCVPKGPQKGEVISIDWALQIVARTPSSYQNAIMEAPGMRDNLATWKEKVAVDSDSNDLALLHNIHPHFWMCLSGI